MRVCGIGRTRVRVRIPGQSARARTKSRAGAQPLRDAILHKQYDISQFGLWGDVVALLGSRGRIKRRRRDVPSSRKATTELVTCIELQIELPR